MSFIKVKNENKGQIDPSFIFENQKFDLSL